MLDIPAHLAALLARLCVVIADFAVRQAAGPRVVWLGAQCYVEKTPPTPHRPLPPAVWPLLALRLQRLSRRFLRLWRRWQTNTLLPPRPRRTAPRRTPARPALRLPRAHGWANRRLPGAHACAGTLHAILQTPDLPRLLAAAPQAGRLLRPLCVALGVDQPAWLKLPPRPKPPCTPPPAAPPPAALPPTPPDRPLQPYVRAAARAWTPGRRKIPAT